jgi:hypothetical protein
VINGCDISPETWYVAIIGGGHNNRRRMDGKPSIDE